MHCAAKPLDINMSTNHSYNRSNWTSNSKNQGRYHESRSSRSFKDDEPPPPGCKAGNPSRGQVILVGVVALNLVIHPRV